MTYLWLLLYALFMLVGNVMNKTNSNAFSSKGITGSLFFVFETSIFALLYFWAFNGFKLEFNSRVILYGFLYGLVVILTVIPSIFVYRYATFSFVSLVSGCLVLLLSLVSGAVFFDEIIGFDKLLRVIIMLCATFVIFLGRNEQNNEKGKQTKEGNKKNITISCLIIAFFAVVSTLGTALVKFYSVDSGVTDQNSFFFMTNIFSALLVLPILPFAMKKDGVSLKDLGLMLRSKKTVFSAVTTLNSNLSSIVLIFLLANMDVSVFTSVSAALSFAVVAVTTPIIKEKLDKYTIAATVIAILSVVIPSFISGLI